ncbi:TPA: hypothetical protein HA231_02315, partial [Candidatus Woesearchaeota archaeon]|nr:hypothetical protein [Candidatus Woesearchaeota archaeon]
MSTENNIRRLQIGVMGSAQDLNYGKRLEELAEEVGLWIAKAGDVLVFGAEKDYDSLSTTACRGARKAGGLTMGFTYGRGKGIYQKDADLLVVTGMERGGGREFVLSAICDCLIGVSGDSGTLNELVVDYQLSIPMVALKGSSGWSEKLANQFFDARRRLAVVGADSPKDAVKKAFVQGAGYLAKFGYKAYVAPDSGLNLK